MSASDEPSAAPAQAARLAGALEDPRRGLWRMALPLMAGMSLQTAYLIVDMIFVGRISAEALTALAFNLPLVFMAMGTTFGLGTGVTAVVARCVGARDKTGADQAAENGLLLAVFLVAIFMVVGLGWGRALLRLLGVPADLQGLAWSYFRIIALGFPFVVSSVFLRSVLSGEGNMKTPVMVQGGATVLNAILDPICIFALGLGIEGAALATVIAQAVAASVFVYLLFVKSHAWVTFNLRAFRMKLPVLRSIVAIGAPSAVSLLVTALGASVFNRILVGYSPEVVAAFQVGARIDQIVLLPMIAVAASLVTLVGMFRGAERLDLVRSIFLYAMTRTVALAAIVAALFLAFAPYLVAVFSSDPAIRGAGVGYLRVAALAYPFTAVSMLAGRSLQGLGRGTPVLLVSLLRVFLISGPLTVIVVFVLHGPVEWVWWAIVTGIVISALCALLWWLRAVGHAERGLAEAAAVGTASLAGDLGGG